MTYLDLLCNFYFMNKFFRLLNSSIFKLILLNSLLLINTIHYKNFILLFKYDYLLRKINLNKNINKKIMNYINLDRIKMPLQTKGIILNPSTSWSERLSILTLFIN
jgi:hypothetical protein